MNSSIQRTQWSELITDIQKPHITLLVGARQTGKTTLLRQIQNKLTEEEKKVYFLTLEDKLILDTLNKHPEELFKIVPKEEQCTILIDEIQYLNDPSNFLKYHYDLYAHQIKLVVTGSSAFYIDQKFTDSLAGRKRVFRISTYNFNEFLRAKNQNDLAPYFQQNNPPFQKRSYPLYHHHKIEQLLSEYIRFGGYPAVVHTPDENEKITILNELHNSFLRKDFLESGIKYEEKAYFLLKVLASQTGELVNTQELAHTLAVSHDTIKQYLYILEKSFIITLIRPFFKNLRKELTKMPKVFFFDNGFRNITLKNFELIESRNDKGATLENMVFKAFVNNQVEETRFWRTQNQQEVDFIINEKLAYEIKYSRKQFKSGKYAGFQKQYPNIPLSLICYSDDEELSLIDII